jgi:hypothetical protein
MTGTEMSQAERNFVAHFGGCPHCGHHDGIVNVGRGHWLHCAEHKVKWCVGSNLFDSWKDQTEEEQRKIWAETIGRTGYREITSEQAHTHSLVKQWERDLNEQMQENGIAAAAGPPDNKCSTSHASTAIALT